LPTTPVQSCVGLWLALDDATLDNGCLWLRPKSHTEPVRRQYIRNSVHFDKNYTVARQLFATSRGQDILRLFDEKQQEPSEESELVIIE
jgi:ectoine hydroxylase-related dioxygenase (phytanoyl-CoA dioxygenase family)